MRGHGLLKCRPREVKPNVENTLFDQLHGSEVVSDEVAGWKAKYTQSSGTLSITTVLLDLEATELSPEIFPPLSEAS